MQEAYTLFECQRAAGDQTEWCHPAKSFIISKCSRAWR
jgi:hypothetical protein